MIFIFPFSNAVSGDDYEIPGSTPIELLTLCYQANNLYFNRDFILPTYPEAHQLVTIFRGAESDVLGFISETSTRIFVVFRGSQSVKDIQRNINYFRVPFYLVPDGGNVHHGFLSTYTKVGKERSLSLRDFIVRTVSKLDSNKKLYITGHSMGAGLATVCALDLAVNSPFTDPIVYTFASPRVGNKAFVDKFNGTINTCVRIQNHYDWVPSIPLTCMGFHHTKGGITIRVKTDSIENQHRINTAYLPGLIAQFAEFIHDLLNLNPIGLIPPIPEHLPEPSWKEEKAKK
jgi:triacylglycerol lipase